VSFATSCTASGAWSGDMPTTGTASFSPTEIGSYTYSLSCVGLAGSSIQSTSLVVHPPPTLEFSINTNQITTTGTATLLWTSTNIDSCSASGSWVGARSETGTRELQNLVAGTYTYVLSCNGAGGAVTRTVSLKVLPTPSVSIYVTPGQIIQGGEVALNWSSSNVVYCEASGGWSGQVPLSGSRSVIVNSVGTVQFILSCTGAGGLAAGVANLTVNPSPNVSSPSSGGGGSVSFTMSILLLAVSIFQCWRAVNYSFRCPDYTRLFRRVDLK
jgi:hypothetical protein